MTAVELSIRPTIRPDRQDPAVVEPETALGTLVDPLSQNDTGPPGFPSLGGFDHQYGLRFSLGLPGGIPDTPPDSSPHDTSVSPEASASEPIPPSAGGAGTPPEPPGVVTDFPDEEARYDPQSGFLLILDPMEKAVLAFLTQQRSRETNPTFRFADSEFWTHIPEAGPFDLFSVLKKISISRGALPVEIGYFPFRVAAFSIKNAHPEKEYYIWQGEVTSDNSIVVTACQSAYRDRVAEDPNALVIKRTYRVIFPGKPDAPDTTPTGEKRSNLFYLSWLDVPYELEYWKFLDAGEFRRISAVSTWGVPDSAKSQKLLAKGLFDSRYADLVGAGEIFHESFEFSHPGDPFYELPPGYFPLSSSDSELFLQGKPIDFQTRGSVPVSLFLLGGAMDRTPRTPPPGPARPGERYARFHTGDQGTSVWHAISESVDPNEDFFLVPPDLISSVADHSSIVVIDDQLFVPGHIWWELHGAPDRASSPPAASSSVGSHGERETQRFGELRERLKGHIPEIAHRLSEGNNPLYKNLPQWEDEAFWSFEIVREKMARAKPPDPKHSISGLLGIVHAVSRTHHQKYGTDPHTFQQKIRGMIIYASAFVDRAVGAGILSHDEAMDFVLSLLKIEGKEQEEYSRRIAPALREKQEEAKIAAGIHPGRYWETYTAMMRKSYSTEFDTIFSRFTRAVGEIVSYPLLSDRERYGVNNFWERIQREITKVSQLPPEKQPEAVEDIFSQLSANLKRIKGMVEKGEEVGPVRSRNALLYAMQYCLCAYDPSRPDALSALSHRIERVERLVAQVFPSSSSTGEEEV